jgi:D-sedoheptulose 7-phosphate isomerase
MDSETANGPILSTQGPLFESSLNVALQVLQSLLPLEAGFNEAAEWCCEALRKGRKILACGNGGSACEAQHLTGELMGRYKSDRAALPAIALNADPVLLTCIGNDYSFDDLFARQVQGLGVPGDVLIAFTTSGDSPNVLKALSTAHQMGLKSIALLGREGGAAITLADRTLLVPHFDTARIQEAHQFLLHLLMDYIERELGNT